MNASALPLQLGQLAMNISSIRRGPFVYALFSIDNNFMYIVRKVNSTPKRTRLIKSRDQRFFCKLSDQRRCERVKRVTYYDHVRYIIYVSPPRPELSLCLVSMLF